jgi:cytochrome c556
MIRILAVICLTVAMLGLGACSRKNDREGRGEDRPAVPTGERSRLERGEPLPELARTSLRKNMIEHGDNMESLLWTALMLDHQTTELMARQILDQPRMSRPTPAAGETLSDWLPPRFFELQDALYEHAEELRRAAQARDDMGMARAYGKLAETCVTCHSLYLRLPAEAGAEDGE